MPPSGSARTAPACGRPGRRPPRRRPHVGGVDAAGVEADRAQAREPADRAGQVGAAHDLLAAVALEVDEHGVGARRVARTAPGASRRPRRPARRAAPRRSSPGSGPATRVSSGAVDLGRHGHGRGWPRWRRCRAAGRPGGRRAAPAGRASMSRQKPELGHAARASGPRRAGAATSAGTTSRPGQRRAPSPASAAAQAAARSGTITRHDTPSVTRWWATSMQAARPVGAGVEPHGPDHAPGRRGRAPATASCQRATPPRPRRPSVPRRAASTRVTQAAASTAPAGGTSSVHRPSLARGPGGRAARRGGRARPAGRRPACRGAAPPAPAAP